MTEKKKKKLSQSWLFLLHSMTLIYGCVPVPFLMRKKRFPLWYLLLNKYCPRKFVSFFKCSFENFTFVVLNGRIISYVKSSGLFFIFVLLFSLKGIEYLSFSASPWGLKCSCIQVFLMSLKTVRSDLRINCLGLPLQ